NRSSINALGRNYITNYVSGNGNEVASLGQGSNFVNNNTAFGDRNKIAVNDPTIAAAGTAANVRIDSWVSGSDNGVSLSSDSRNSEINTVTQGNRNNMFVKQPSGNNNNLYASLYGDYNFMSATQLGKDNELSLNASGTSNTVVALQDGANNIMDV